MTVKIELKWRNGNVTIAELPDAHFLPRFFRYGTFGGELFERFRETMVYQEKPTRLLHLSTVVETRGVRVRK